jgi:hypothetical protein
MSGPGYGTCCACEQEISPRDPCVVMLPFEAPTGFKGWGCLVCKLPQRGAIAVLCQDCLNANRQPRFIATGVHVGDNLRFPLTSYVQIPFEHNLAFHPELQPSPNRAERRRRRH